MANELDCSSLELSILQGFTHHDCCESELPVIVGNFLSGNYEAVIADPFTTEVVGGDLEELQPSEIQALVLKNINSLLSTDPKSALKILVVGVSCLQIFLQNNWTGPLTEAFSLEKFYQNWCPKVIYQEDKLHSLLVKELCKDGEAVYKLCRQLPCFFLAKSILLESSTFRQQLWSGEWWRFRVVSVYQRLLDDKSPSLKDIADEALTAMTHKMALLDKKNRELEICYELEAAYLKQDYYEYQKSKERFLSAANMAHLNVSLTGALGKRTRFQSKDVAQVLLEVKRTQPDETEAQLLELHVPAVKLNASLLPKNLSHNDDTVLENIEFSEISEPDLQVNQLEQAIVLGLMEVSRRSEPNQEKLTNEQLLAYISFLLNQPLDWSIQVTALYTRSFLEKSFARTIERSMKQIEEIISQMSNQQPPSQKRLPQFYYTRTPPVWLLKKQLAQLLISLGSIGSACDILEQLEMWEDVIVCYQRMNKLEKAESLIREQLEIEETPNLWCFLGDVTRNIEHYQKAWELSNHRSARAQRCMGYLYFGKEDWDNCLSCFERSLKINTLQTPLWFTYGCASLAASKFETAAKAFHRCVMIDSDNFEAWGNLSTAYLKLKKKKKAFAVLQDAIKCSYDNWRLWENYLIIGTDCGQFSEVIRAYHRLMDLRGKWLDVEILKILVKAIKEDIPDANAIPSSYLLPKALELFGRLTSKVTTDAQVWELYAKLTELKTEDPMKDERVLQFLQKAYKCSTQESGWEKNPEKCNEKGSLALELADAHLIYSAQAKHSTISVQTLSSAKLMLRSILSTIKKFHGDAITGDIEDNVKEICSKLDSAITIVISKLTLAQT
ncbi:repeat 27 [Octopus vulgaris]|uniref:Repeat 27 n=1 Tax=Octopus vulgaris TaxID=6645 RepID=A0AA36F278_OCTVU|nr:repeat 27 [Octopus vulgaris]